MHSSEGTLSAFAMSNALLDHLNTHKMFSILSLKNKSAVIDYTIFIHDVIHSHISTTLTTHMGAWYICRSDACLCCVQLLCGVLHIHECDCVAVSQVCEQTGEDLVMCEGQCCASYHLHCIGLDQSAEKVLCSACSSGETRMVM